MANETLSALIDLRRHARDLSSVAQTVATICGAASGLTPCRPTWESREMARKAALAYLEDLDVLMMRVREAARRVKTARGSDE